MASHRISAGALIEQGGRLLMVHHRRPGRYDFWVAPGGGVKGDESLEQAAKREVWEETGLVIEVDRLIYIEDLVDPACRLVKFWFLAQVAGGGLGCSHPEAQLEHIVEAAWLAPSELAGRQIYPRLLLERYEQDRRAGFPGIVRLPMSRMDSG